MTSRALSTSRAPWAPLATVLVLTVGQLVVASTSDAPRFAAKGFEARLLAYPVLVLLVPVLWWVAARTGRTGGRAVPWTGFVLVAAPFLVDVTGNTLDLYDRLVWWDDANHCSNWFLLVLGLCLVLDAAPVRPGWARAAAVVGGGALLALLWEVGEFFAFIRFGTERAVAYEDTLGDMVLGTSGSVLALLVVVTTTRRAGVADPNA